MVGRWFLLLGAFSLFSLQEGWCRGRHADRAVPSEISSNDSSSFLEDALPIDGELLQRRFSDTKELAQMLGIPFDQNFVNKAFDFYSKRGMLRDEPNVSEADIRTFLREVGGIPATDDLVKLGKAFVDRKKDEFREKDDEKESPGKTDVNASDSAVILTKSQSSMISRVDSESSSPPSPFVTSPRGDSPPTGGAQRSAPSQVSNRNFPVFPSVVLPMSNGTSPSPSLSVFNQTSSPEQLSLGTQISGEKASLAEGTPPRTENPSAPVSVESVGEPRIESVAARMESLRSVTEKTPVVPLSTGTSETAPVQNRAESKPDLSTGIVMENETVKESEAKGVKTVDAGVGVPTTELNSAVVTFAGAQTLLTKVRSESAKKGPKSILDSFYEFFRKSALSSTPAIVEASTAARLPANLGTMFTEAEPNGHPASLFIYLGVPALLWLLWRGIRRSRRVRISQTEVLENPIRRHRDLN